MSIWPCSKRNSELQLAGFSQSSWFQALLSIHQLSTQVLQPSYKTFRLQAKLKQKNTARATDKNSERGTGNLIALKSGTSWRCLYAATLAMVQLSPPGWTRVLSAVLFLWLYSQEKTLEGTFGGRKKTFQAMVPLLWSVSMWHPFHHFQRQRGSVSTAEVASHAP